MSSNKLDSRLYRDPLIGGLRGGEDRPRAGASPRLTLSKAEMKKLLPLERRFWRELAPNFSWLTQDDKHTFKQFIRVTAWLDNKTPDLGKAYHDAVKTLLAFNRALRENRTLIRNTVESTETIDVTPTKENPYDRRLALDDQ